MEYAEAARNDLRSFSALKGRKKADVAVVGGGVSGLCTALWLSKAGLQTTILEAGRLGQGITASCMGCVIPPFIHAGWSKPAAAMAMTHAFDAVKTLRDMTQDADVGWTDAEHCLFSQNELALEKNLSALHEGGFAAEKCNAENLPCKARHAIRVQGTGWIHMRKYLSFLLESCVENGCTICEQSRVTEVEADRVFTDTASLTAPYIVIATGYPIVNIPGWYFMRMEQRECRVYRTLAETDGRIMASADGSVLMRPFSQGSLLMLNEARGSGMQEETAFLEKTEEVFRSGLELQKDRGTRGYETFTADGLLYAGVYSRKTPNLHAAFGYGGAGLTGSLTAAKAIAAAVMGLPTDAYRIYSGQRKLTGLRMPLSIGRRFAASWLMHPHAPVCPHLGCKLRYNPQSRLWECPCHGSRFDDIGHVLSAPSVRDARLKDRR